MSSYTNNQPLEGMSGGNYLFSPAEFGDADDLRPTAAFIDIVGNGTSTPYTTAINSVLQKHIEEIKQKTATTVLLPTGWKKRLRDFLSQKNTDLLDFLSLSITSHPTLGKGDAILRKFAATHFNVNHATVKEMVLDSSGVNVVNEINETLNAIRLSSSDCLADYIAAQKYIFDQYRESGEEALKQEFILKSKLDLLDKAQAKIATMLDLDPIDKYHPLMESIEDYLGGLFKKHAIENDYKAFIAAYRRFITLRDVVLMSRAIQAHENEPLCTICIQEQVSNVLVPCGHTFCVTCIKRQNGSCFICRTAIREKTRLYFG